MIYHLAFELGQMPDDIRRLTERDFVALAATFDARIEARKVK